MGEGQFPSVQHQAGQVNELPIRLRINRVPKNGAVQGLTHVNADLMGSTGEQATLNQGATFVLSDAGPLRDGFLAGRFLRANRHSFAVHRMATNAVLDATIASHGHSIDHREIDFRDRAIREGLCKPGMREIMLCCDQAAAGFLIEAMDNARAQFATDPAEILAMVEQGID
jgi:hypothetical protein